MMVKFFETKDRFQDQHFTLKFHKQTKLSRRLWQPVCVFLTWCRLCRLPGTPSASRGLQICKILRNGESPEYTIIPVSKTSETVLLNSSSNKKQDICRRKLLYLTEIDEKCFQTLERLTEHWNSTILISLFFLLFFSKFHIFSCSNSSTSSKPISDFSSP